MTTDNGVDVTFYGIGTSVGIPLQPAFCQWDVTSFLMWWKDIYWSCINLCEPIQADAILYRERNWHVPGSCKCRQNECVKFVHVCVEYLWWS